VATDRAQALAETASAQAVGKRSPTRGVRRVTALAVLSVGREWSENRKSKEDYYMPFFEPLEKLDPKNVDLERARKSLREELEAIDFYQERIDATDDASLKRLLQHNMNEEKEHVAMLVEWLRKNDPLQDRVFMEHD